MDTNGTSNTANTRVQPSIRSFFQPRQPSYTAPPAPPTSRLESAGPLPQASQLPLESPANHAPTIPEQATISLVLSEHIPPLRRINALLLPISYPDSFYQQIVTPDAPVSFSRAITWTDPKSPQSTVIGGMVCRLDPALAPDSTPQDTKYTPGYFDIYIPSLALLSPYRRMGLVAEVLKEVVEAATAQSDIKVASLYAHVWTENEEALEWYTSRGFKREEPVLHGYYRRLKPDTAWIFRRRLLPSDHLASPKSSHTSVTAPTVTDPTSSPAIEPRARPRLPPSARSFQERGPDREWNDLPEDILGAGLKPPNLYASREGSTTSSRSSSRSGIEKAKKKRTYPAAAFGS
jgi:ribosomal protein S18 acetylase RimI-like enzyme